MHFTTSARALTATAATAALTTTGLMVVSGPADAALVGSVVVYQCGTSVCAIDPDVAGSNRVIATNAIPAGVTRDGRTAGIVDRSTQEIREIALVAGGTSRVMSQPGAADPPTFAAISDSGALSSWVWYYADLGWYARVAPAGSNSTAWASSTAQLSVGWYGDQLLTTRRGASGYDSRICLEVAGGPVCDTLLASEPDRNQHAAFPDINPSGSHVVAVRGPENTGFGLPYYGPLAIYAVGSTTGPQLLTNGADSQPEFSYEGDRVVFERQNAGIYVIGTDGTGLRKIADGSMPFWGGARHDSPAPTPTSTPTPTPTPTPAPTKPPTTPTPTPTTTPTTPTADTRVDVVVVRAPRKAGKPYVVTLACPAAHVGTCTGKTVLTTARKYRLVKAKKRRIVVARGAYEVAAGEQVQVRARLTKDGRRLLRKTRVKTVVASVVETS